MAKVRASITIDANLWDSVRTLFGENPELGSISAYVEMNLRDFMAVMPDFVARARVGDKDAAVMVLNRAFNTSVGQSSSFLNQMYALPSDVPLPFEQPKKKGVSKKNSV
jgi:hypothetical protein